MPSAMMSKYTETPLCIPRQPWTAKLDFTVLLKFFFSKQD